MDAITLFPDIPASYKLIFTIVDRFSKHTPCVESMYAEYFGYLFLYCVGARHKMQYMIVFYCGPRLTSKFLSALVFALRCEYAKPETDG